MHSFNLSGKTILVTGASSGIGRQTALTLSQMGAKLVISGQSERRLNEILVELENDEHLAFPADLTDSSQLAALTEQLPVLNGMAFCAGIWKSAPIKFLQPELAMQLLQINYLAPQALVSQLLQQKKLHHLSSLVFVSSIAAQHPYKGGSAYAASKAALEAFSKTLSLEVAHIGIRSNCVAPAMVQTQIFEQSQNLVSENLMTQHAQQYPLGIGKPLDVAHAIAYLLSDASEWITGTTLRLDGGLSVGA